MALLLSPKVWIALAFVALLAIIGGQQVRVNHAKTKLAEYKLEVAENARLSEQLARQESERMQRGYDEQAAIAREEKAALESDVAKLADVADGVRDELAAFKQRAKQNACAVVGSKGKPSADPIDLLAVLYARADREAAAIAEYADRLRQAGIACERSADSLAPKP